MAQVNSGVNLPLLSKTKPSQEIEKEPLPRFLPPTDVERRSKLTSLNILREHEEKRESVGVVFKRLALMELPSKAYVQCYLLDMNRRNCKRKSLLEALNSLKLFLTFLKNTGKTQLEQLTRADPEAFIEHEQDMGLQPSSVRTYLGRVNAFLHFLVEEGIVHPDVLTRKIRLKLPHYLPRAIDPDDVRQHKILNKGFNLLPGKTQIVPEVKGEVICQSIVRANGSDGAIFIGCECHRWGFSHQILFLSRCAVAQQKLQFFCQRGIVW